MRSAPVSRLPWGLLLVAWVAAADQEPPGALSFVAYGEEAGFGRWVVKALAQDTQGLLWVGTDDGLYVYDGHRFRRAPSEGLPSPAIYQLVAGPDGQLWCQTSEGWARWRQGRWSRYAPEDEAPGPWDELRVDGTGRAWGSSPRGLLREGDDGRLAVVEGWPEGPALGLWVEGGGEVYAVRQGALHHRDAQGRWHTWGEAQGLPRDERLHRVARDGEGRLWAWNHYRLWQRPPGATDFQPAPALEANRSLWSAMRDRHGTLWLNSDKGLVQLGRDGVPRPVSGPPTLRVNALLEDREGSLWVGGMGLFRVKGRGLWRTHGLAQGLPSEELWTIQRDAAGQLWAGTSQGLARATAEGWRVEAAVPMQAVRALAEEPGGALWLGGGWGELLRYEPRSGRLQRLGPGSGLGATVVLDLMLEQDGTLWVATNARGLLRAEGQGAARRLVPVPLPGGTPDEPIFDLLRDARGRLWVAGMRGLRVREGGTFRRFTPEDGLRRASASYLLQRRDGQVCASYFRVAGLSCFRYEQGRLEGLTHLDTSTGLASDRVYQLGEDAQGRLWVGTGRGVDVLGPEGRVHFGTVDGLPGEDCNARAFWAEAGGDVWVGTSTGLGQFLGLRYQGPVPPPAVVLAEVRAGGKPLAPAPHPPALPFERNTLEYEVRTRTFLNEAQLAREVRLVGLEPQWRALEGHQARYTSLAPGAYEFQARARHPGGAWGPPARFAFRVERPPWQSPWVYAGGALGLGALLALVVRVREGAVHRRNAVLEALVMRRTRELEEAQARLVRVEREAAEQTMAGGFAHEMRNALTGAKMLLATVLRGAGGEAGAGSVCARNAELLQALYLRVRERLPPEERREVAQLLKQLNANEARLDGVLGGADEALGRALAFTRMLLEYARLGREQPGTEQVRVAQVVRSVLAESHEDLAAQAIEVRVEGEEDCALVGSALHLYSLVKNLVLNARDALARRAGEGERVLQVAWAREAEGLVLRVADTGVGMPPEVRERMFEPFFTTRPAGGTGLGLSVVRKLVALYGGTLEVRSEPGRGTTFTLWLPGPAAPGDAAGPPTGT